MAINGGWEVSSFKVQWSWSEKEEAPVSTAAPTAMGSEKTYKRTTTSSTLFMAFPAMATGLSNCDDMLSIYVGDNRTDEDAFKVWGRAADDGNDNEDDDVDDDSNNNKNYDIECKANNEEKEDDGSYENETIDEDNEENYYDEDEEDDSNIEIALYDHIGTSSPSFESMSEQMYSN
ncbi:chromatin-remodeling ATPase INO80 [Ricinus communis]|uniref:chromatin-remodeling ATPase INO80 n=1 Tax=Ricinus communis TaxID=3988 RepID=UPI00201A9898|nr:chromatin-remodeling ATPase INO80 [Ricinus communis]